MNDLFDFLLTKFVRLCYMLLPTELQTLIYFTSLSATFLTLKLTRQLYVPVFELVVGAYIIKG